MRTIKFFFRRRRRGTPSVLAASRARFASKSGWILVGPERFFPRFSIFLRFSSYSADSISYFDTFTSTTGARTSRKQQRRQRHHQQQLRKRESERASSKNFVRKKISQKRFSERVRAREFLWIKISTHKNGDERLR